MPLPINAPAPGDGPLIIVNAGRTGFFRVNYSAEMWERSRPAISQSPADGRAPGLGSRCVRLMRAGYLPATQFLSLAPAYVQEREYPVWSDLVGSGWIANILAREAFEEQFSAFARSLLKPIVAHLGWEPQLHDLTSTPCSGAWCCTRSDITRRTRSSLKRGRASIDISASRRRCIPTCAAPCSIWRPLGDRLTYDALREVERRATLQEEKLRALAALTHFQQPDSCGIRWSRHSPVRSQDTIRVVAWP